MFCHSALRHIPNFLHFLEEIKHEIIYRGILITMRAQRVRNKYIWKTPLYVRAWLRSRCITSYIINIRSLTKRSHPSCMGKQSKIIPVQINLLSVMAGLGSRPPQAPIHVSTPRSYIIHIIYWEFIIPLNFVLFGAKRAVYFSRLLESIQCQLLSVEQLCICTTA